MLLVIFKMHNGYSQNLVSKEQEIFFLTQYISRYTDDVQEEELKFLDPSRQYKLCPKSVKRCQQCRMVFTDINDKSVIKTVGACNGWFVEPKNVYE